MDGISVRDGSSALECEAVAAKQTSPASLPMTQPADRKGALKSIGGSQSDAWNNLLTNQALQALWLKDVDPETRERRLSTTVAALVGIGPKDELEGMMAAQLIAAHHAAMECYRRAMNAEQTLEGRSANLSQANKLSRTFATLLEALNRHRGKGQQKVTVEHVHVHAGGQAVVGVVGNEPGGGEPAELKEQPHAKQVAYAPEPALPSFDAETNPLPITGHEERPVSNARRHVARRAKEE